MANDTAGKVRRVARADDVKLIRPADPLQGAALLLLDESALRVPLSRSALGPCSVSLACRVEALALRPESSATTACFA